MATAKKSIAKTTKTAKKPAKRQPAAKKPAAKKPVAEKSAQKPASKKAAPKAARPTQTIPGNTLAALIARLKQGKDGALMARFADIYFTGVPERDLAEIGMDALAKNVTDLFAFYRKHTGDIAVRVTNPAYTPHSVAEIIMRNQPFLVDTVWGEMYRRGYEVHNTFHPVMAASRDTAGKLTDLKPGADAPEPTNGILREAVIHIQFDRQDDLATLEDIRQSLLDVLTHARHVAADFPQMVAQLMEIAGGLKSRQKYAEETAFFHWLIDGNFIFLGYRHYEVTHKDNTPWMQLSRGSGLGLMRNDKGSGVYQPKPIDQLAPNMAHYLTTPDLLTITKALTKSPVHRHADMDYVGIKQFDKSGRVVGEHRFLGLLTSRAYTSSALEIPIIRQKIEAVMARESRKHGIQSHNTRALVNILETYPRDELFQIGEDDLHRIATGILHLKERQQVRVFIRHSAHERLVTAMVFIPRDRMSSALRRRIVDLLMETYNGEDAEFLTTLGDSLLARIFLKIRTRPPEPPKVDDAAVEARVIATARSWEDDLAVALTARHGPNQARRLMARYGNAFRAGYRENTPVDVAVNDIAGVEKILAGETFLVDVARQGGGVHLKVLHRGGRIPLADIMPLFNNLGLTAVDEHPAQISVPTEDNTEVWLHDFGLQLQPGQDTITQEDTITRLADALGRMWRGDMESDSLGRLIVTAGLDVRQVTILRALVGYLQQTGGRYASEYIREALTKHPALAALLVDLFDARFDPALSSDTADKLAAGLAKKIDDGLRDVSVLDEDVIIRRLFGTVQAMVRTNAWQRQSPTEPLAFKLRSADVPGLAKPHPLFEIFVYHARVEGIHLRGGPVARGGLRWSDRPADFRTEVLGLMKTQMTKNTVIVPGGSKGGFVLKTPPCDLKTMANCDRDTLRRAVEDAYRTFVSCLLSVTDNVVAGQVVPPKQVRRHDDDDPYLVVAADKGTATFSDLANSIAMEADYWGPKAKGFWLGDAFASGGSNGYDHKKMGITARGAWVCVQHHFRSLGRDIQKEPFTTIAIGDMAGDVFGNGMLLSRKTKLVAAFNHLHIFIDPTPNIETSYAERERLFKAVAGWDQYDKRKISAGGGVFKRSDKSIPLSPQIQKLLGVKVASMPPNELIRTILKADVDLWWNGGIGTFVKAADESHMDVGDRANDDIRINAADVRARVVGEGGNLGFTQRARIAYALTGGLINTDAIDNSAGVDSSDHEVNIKILLNLALEKGKLTLPARNKLLAEMTEDVARLSLRDNEQQSQILSVAEQVSRTSLDTHVRLIQKLERTGLLDARLEDLPDEEEIERRRAAGTGLTRPELAVIMAYAKMDLAEQLKAAGVAHDKALESYLVNYFPPVLQSRYGSIMNEHRLRDDIIVTAVTNELINRMGLTFLDRMRDETGHSEATVTRAFLVAKNLFCTDDWWRAIDALDTKLAADVQLEMFDTVKKLLEATAFWFLRSGLLPRATAGSLITRYSSPVCEVADNLEAHLPLAMKETFNARRTQWRDKGLDAGTARTFAALSFLKTAPDVADLALDSRRPVAEVMDVYFRVGDMLRTSLLNSCIRSIPVENNWQRVASLSILEGLFGYQKRVAAQVLAERAPKQKVDAAIASWISGKNGAYDQYLRLLDEIADQPAVTHAMMNVVLGQLKGLVG